MSAERRNFWNDEGGAVLIEFTAVVLTFFVILFGIIEFSYAYYQWNAATKAVQYGARLAAVSEPAVPDFRKFTGLSSTVLPGDPLPPLAFDYTCTSDLEDGCDANALRLIVFGRCDVGETCSTVTINGSTVSVRTACNINSTPRNIGMCNLSSKVTGIDKVRVRYEHTGLGYAGRPVGPVPTITVSLRDVQIDFILMGAFLPVNAIPMPSFATTVTGEDLNTTWTS
ncbi:TadE/TadG family type IV pilus assembly protein [Aestuariivirga sp.]|uniref:TadE/TadG family type IV pilus assembly protein n=1 Tax=Aestuariivirga sp. TaxID=2650926 RepID=UPI00391C904C